MFPYVTFFNIARGFNHGERIVEDILCVPAVETAGYIFFTYIFSNIARGFNHGERIVEDILCVPAVETAGYVSLGNVFQYSPWFQPLETYR